MTRSLSRRDLLGALGAGAPLSLARPSGGGARPARIAAPDDAPSPFPADLRVMTRNLAIGTNFSRAAADRTVDPEAVYDRYRQATESAPDARMRAVADEIAAAMPAVVGLQEAARIRTRRPSGYEGGTEPGATTEAFDFLAALRSGLEAALGERGPSPGYRLAAAVETTDEEFPARPPDGPAFDVRLTDRTALLVRGDLTVAATAADTYPTAIDVTLTDGTRVTVRRGYALAELDLGGLPVTVATTHLEQSASLVRHAQAARLRDVLARREGPVIVAADLNSGPAAGPRSVYAAFTETYADAWEGGEGPTCCQWATLRNERSRLRRRIDHVLHRGPVESRGAWRTGIEPSARVETGTGAVWPSNHAGVVADLWLPTAGTDPLAAGRRVLGGYAGGSSREASASSSDT